jgi:hypothetical protein
MTTTIVMRCTDVEICSAHAQGDARKDEKCPGVCDAPGCTEDVTGDEYCTGHAVLDEAGATADEMATATRKADRYGVTLARLLREAVRTVPLNQVARTPFALQAAPSRSEK